MSAHRQEREDKTKEIIAAVAGEMMPDSSRYRWNQRMGEEDSILGSLDNSDIASEGSFSSDEKTGRNVCDITEGLDIALLCLNHRLQANKVIPLSVIVR